MKLKSLSVMGGLVTDVGETLLFIWMATYPGGYRSTECSHFDFTSHILMTIYMMLLVYVLPTIQVLDFNAINHGTEVDIG